MARKGPLPVPATGSGLNLDARAEFLYKRYYFFDHENFNYLLHQEKPLTALANLKAIEISILILENLNQNVPHFEIYSARKISSSLSYLIDQTPDQIAKNAL